MNGRKKTQTEKKIFCALNLKILGAVIILRNQPTYGTQFYNSQVCEQMISSNLGLLEEGIPKVSFRI